MTTGPEPSFICLSASHTPLLPADAPLQSRCLLQSAAPSRPPHRGEVAPGPLMATHQSTILSCDLATESERDGKVRVRDVNWLIL